MCIGFRHCLCLLVAALCAACGTRETTVEFYFADARSGVGPGYRFSQAERRAIEDIVESTAIETRRVLPTLPRGLVIRIHPGKDVIPETGETASTVSPATVIWVVDPAHKGGVLSVVHTWLRATLLHEFHHLVRTQTITSTSLMDEVITEGMATVFERDVAGVSPPWGTYPENAADWVAELIALPPGSGTSYWVRARHPDGRRWIGMRAGTYLVDRAMKASGRSAADLVSAPAEEVIKIAATGMASR